jgi:hypothetical protein
MTTTRKIDDLNLYLSVYGGVNENLTTNSMRKIRTYAEKKYSRNFTNIQQLAKYLNTTKLNAQRALVLEYNKSLDKERKTIKTTKQQLKKELKNFNYDIITPVVIKDRTKPKFHIQKLGKYIKYWVKTHKGIFELVLQSRISKVKRTLTFTHIEHFNNWYNHLMADKEVDSAGNPLNTMNNNEYDLFENVIVNDVRVIVGGCNSHKPASVKMKSSFYEYELYNPASKDNNCFLACLNHIKSLGEGRYIYAKIRKQFNLPAGSEISIDDAYKIARELNYDIQIIRSDINEQLDDETKYIVYENNHYFVLDSFTEINKKDRKTKRGTLAVDLETRKTEEFDIIKATKQKMYIIKDTLTRAYYNNYKSDKMKSLKFITDETKSSARQFIDWLNEQTKRNKTYNIIAHNGGRFDYYFFISCLTEKELTECDLHFRGTTIISINYRGHNFKDTACFLTDSLKNLSQQFKAEHGKITNFNIHGVELSSEQLCFYKNELKFNEFLDLQHTDKEFWGLYEEYCLYDCMALYEIWEKFGDCVDTLIERINPHLLGKCRLNSSTTIGSHSKKIIVEINKYDGKINKSKRRIEKFTGISYKKVGEKFEKEVDFDKYNFICKFKRGGISHCGKPGKHLSGITGIDIASQYPAALIYCKIPCGESKWSNTYDKDKKGFYLIKNIVFNGLELKPVALSVKNTSLNWATNKMNELYADSYMIEYLIENCGLESFDVENALLSDEDMTGDELFGAYINTFYDEKKRQDRLKFEKSPEYNEAVRTTIKLYLNSLTGKLVENPAIHFSIKFDDEGTTNLNGQKMTKTHNEDKINDWVVAGVMVYSYSKRLLFEYINCLPNKADDVIHIETDGIYFSTRDYDAFKENLTDYKGDYPCRFGVNLGEIKQEKCTGEGDVAYFLGKKFYCITIPDDDNILRIKGIPQKTINDDGSVKRIVDVDLYETIYSGKNVSRTFQVLKKSLFCDNTRISSFNMTRTINSQGADFYKLYK